MRKAQAQSQAFIYILAIIIIGMLLIFGVKYIGQIMNKVEDINLLQFKTDLESDANRIGPSYGTWEKLEIDIPDGVETVCFVESADSISGGVLSTGICDANSDDYDFRMCNAWQDDTSRNVYTVPFDALDTGIYLGEIEVDSSEGYLCFDVGDSKLKIKMTGYGNKLKISSW